MVRNTVSMVAVAQSVEHRIVIPVVVGSIPISHPIQINNCKLYFLATLKTCHSSPKFGRWLFGRAHLTNLLRSLRFTLFVVHHFTINVPVPGELPNQAKIGV
jgi:hypothetical protein